MGSLSSIYIKKEVLETLLKVTDKKGEKGIELTISIGEETNTYGQNLSAYVSQSKEQREAKKEKYYVGNGKVFWTDGKISVAVKKEEVHEAKPIQNEVEDDLPFWENPNLKLLIETFDLHPLIWGCFYLDYLESF